MTLYGRYLVQLAQHLGTPRNTYSSRNTYSYITRRLLTRRRLAAIGSRWEMVFELAIVIGAPPDVQEPFTINVRLPVPARGTGAVLPGGRAGV